MKSPTRSMSECQPACEPAEESSPPLVYPDDRHNRTLVENVHPPDWVNPEPASRYHLVVVGAGTAGLVTAAGAAGLGARVALVERHLLGGDCLNVGCVPSKCVIRSSRLAADLKEAAAHGIRPAAGLEIDFSAVMERMRRLRAHISHHDAASRFRDLGVDVFLGQGRFTGPGAFAVNGTTLRFKKAVIATGARAVSPDIPGLKEAGFLTNETVFSLTARPRRLAVIGAGPIGSELAQAFQRLGVEVRLLHDSPHILNREDPDAAGIVQDVFLREGIRLHLNCRILQVRARGDGKEILFESEGRPHTIEVDEILVGAGRAPNVEDLGLDTVGVAWDPRQGVQVDDRLRTSNRSIYAAGDICMRYKFTHAADFAARIVIRNALFLGRARLSSLNMPWCTYTSPEIAHVGLYDHQARERNIPFETFVRPLNEVDRALADGEENGFVKILVRKGGDRILGATIVAAHAGDLISEISVAMKAGMGLGRLAEVIHPYPTQAEAIRQLGDAYNRTRLTSLTRKVLGLWLSWTG